MVTATTVTPTVTKVGGNFEYWDNLHPVLNAVADEMGKSIHCWNAHGRCVSPENVIQEFTNNEGDFKSEDLYFVFWSAATDVDAFEFVMNIDDIFGGNYGAAANNRQGIASTSAAKVPSGAGLNLVSEEGIPFGEVVGNIVYINWDVPHVTWGAGFISEALPIINEALFSPDNPSMEDFVNRLREEMEKAAREAYIRACQPRLRQRSESLMLQITERNNIINELRGSLVMNLRELNGYQAELEAAQIAEKRASKSTDKFAREWDVLKSLAKVANIRYDQTDDALVVTTVPIITMWLADDTKRLLGTYEIWYYLGTNPVVQGGLKLVNLTNNHPDEGYPHPHARSQTNICWGNVGTAVAMLIGEHEYSAVTELILKFLEEPNTSDAWGSSTWAWPVAEKRNDNVIPYERPGDEPYADEDDENYCGECDQSPCICCWTCREYYESGDTGELPEDCGWAEGPIGCVAGCPCQ
jgi:hypothetical protein